MKKIEAKIPFIYVGLSSKFLKQLRSQGLAPSVLTEKGFDKEGMAKEYQR